MDLEAENKDVLLRGVHIRRKYRCKNC